MKPDNKLSKFIYWIVLLSFLLPIGFLIYRVATFDTAAEGIGYHSRADYVLMLVQCILGFIVIHVPHCFHKYLKIEIPTPLFIMYIVFLFCAIFLGEVKSFYYIFPHWDSWLHGFSAVMMGTLGFILIDVLNKSGNIGINLSPIFSTVFAFCFATSIGVLWEIYEFTFDGILGLNMQKFMLEDGTKLIGRFALSDTMKDIIINCCGALISSIIGFVSLKRKKNPVSY